jgi:thiol-disulfide isomerase/thioredoxin
VLALSILAVVGCIPSLTSDEEEVVGTWVPPENSWSIVEPPPDLAGQGFQVGEVPPDFRLLDQYGDEVSLWQFYGSPVVLDISTMWCAPCQELALDAQETAEDYEDVGLVYLTVLAEDADGDIAEPEELDLWAETFEIAQPVVGDPEREWSGPAVPDGVYPVVLILDPTLVVDSKVSPPTDANVRAAVDAVIGG